MSDIGFQGVGKVFPDGTAAVTDFDLEIPDGSLVVLVGPSGCGKTTVLRMVAGLEEISTGLVRIGNRIVNGVPSRDRDVAMVFQNYALYPHMSVYDNMGFSLKVRHLAKREIDVRVREAAEILDLEDQLTKKPRHLSGGQRQRVAMGRAIVRKPEVFLMDEPLSNLDAQLRVQMRAEIARIQRDLGVTTIYVTHDQTEAMTLGDNVAVMQGGLLQQVDAPQTLYDYPGNLFVGRFIGSPAMNLVEGQLYREGDGEWLRFGETKLNVSRVVAARPELRPWVGKGVVLGIRPEHLSEGGEGDGLEEEEGKTFRADVDLREDMGSEAYVYFAVKAPPLRTAQAGSLVGEIDIEPLAPGRMKDDQSHTTFVARLNARSAVREGTTMTVRVDTSELHFFDPVDGLRVA